MTRLGCVIRQAVFMAGNLREMLNRIQRLNRACRSISPSRPARRTIIGCVSRLGDVGVRALRAHLAKCAPEITVHAALGDVLLHFVVRDARDAETRE